MVPDFSVRVTVPEAPGAIEIEVGEMVPVKPAACADIKPKVAAEQAEESLFLMVAVKTALLLGLTVTVEGDRVTVGLASVQGAAP